MESRIAQEIELLRQIFPSLEVGTNGWVRVADYSVPVEGGWSVPTVSLAFQFPAGYPGQKPYGFFISPILVHASGAQVNNAGVVDDLPWGGPWLKFSWDLPEWTPAADVRAGSNMVNFAITIVHRLREGC